MAAPDISHASLTLGRVLYDNLARQSGATITWSGTESTAQPYENAFDWRDFSLFRVTATETANLDIVLPLGGTLDCWSVFTSKYEATAAATITLYYESAPAVFTQLGQVTITDEAKLSMIAFTEVTVAAGRKIRFTIAASDEDLLIRQLAAGPRLDFPMGQFQGITPPNLLQGVVQDTVVGVNGSFLGRNIRREVRTTEIDLMYLDPDWVRSEWQAFAQHAKKNAFFYMWAPELYPNEAVFAWGKINPPVNSGPAALMQVSMPLNCLVADEDVL